MDNIEYLKPLQQAWERMVTMLFRPFTAGKWFVVGFTAWLANLMQSSGGNASFPGASDFESDEPAAVLEPMMRFIREHLPLVVSFVVVLVAFFFILWLLFLWLSTRGRFMFLSNVVRNEAKVAQPWTVYRAQGNSLFLWLLAFGAICILLSAVIIGVSVVIALPDIRQETFGTPAITAICAGTAILIPYLFVVIYAMTLLESFVIPIMYRHNLTCTAAWRRFLPLFRTHPGSFILYGLFLVLLWLLVTVALLAVCILTCCCGLIVLCIPYINMVILLPVYVFFRFYSLEFLGQFGPAFDLLPRPPDIRGPHFPAHRIPLGRGTA